MTLHLVHAALDRRVFAEWRGRRGFENDPGAALHALLAGLFGKGIVQPFRFMASHGGGGDLYAYARCDADALRVTAREVGTPDALAVLPIEALRTKPMPASFPSGRRLGFDIRLRPVRRTRSPLLGPDEMIRAGAEIDAFLLEALRQHGDVANGMALGGRSREAVYRDWLDERLDGAATIEAARLTAFERLVVQRPDHRRERKPTRIEGPDATFQGTLVVEDPAAFASLLSRGVGRHLAWGYGMLLLRPPDPAPVPC